MKNIVISLTNDTFEKYLFYNLHHEDDKIDFNYICEEMLKAFFKNNNKRKVKVKKND